MNGPARDETGRGLTDGASNRMDPLTRYNPNAIRPGGGGGSAPSRDGGGAGLLDVLDRVLDKGVVIAGDIRVNLLDIELLTVKVRLLIASADKAREMGIDWWAHDPHLSSQAKQDQQRLEASKENKALRDRVEKLEAQLRSLTDQGTAPNGGQRARTAVTRRD